MKLTIEQVVTMINESTPVKELKWEHEQLLEFVKRDDISWGTIYVIPEFIAHGERGETELMPDQFHVCATSGLAEYFVAMEIETKLVTTIGIAREILVDVGLLARMKAAVKRDAPEFVDRCQQEYIAQMVNEGVDIGWRVPDWLLDPFEYVA